MKTSVSNSIQETAKIAADWLRFAIRVRKVEPGDGALVVGLSGHLGAGKTAFVKAVAAELGVTETVTSPTFVIMKMYEVPGSASASAAFWRLVHIDAYRLERHADLEALRLEELASDPHNLIMIEWPENVALGVGAGSGGLDQLLRFEIKDGAYTISASDTMTV